MPTFYQLEQQLENRVDAQLLLQLVRATHDDVAAVREAQAQHAAYEAEALAEAIDALTQAAFPGGDTTGHREYHAAKIEEAKARAEFWRKLTFELSKWGLIGFLAWLAADVARNHGFIK